MKDNDWVQIYSSPQEFEIAVLKEVLEENGISSVVINKRDSSYHFGEFELYVETGNALMARNLIEKQQL